MADAVTGRVADDDRLPSKERVVYIEVGDEALAVPFSSLAKVRRMTFDTEEGEVDVRWKAASPRRSTGSGLPPVEMWARPP